MDIHSTLFGWHTIRNCPYIKWQQASVLINFFLSCIQTNNTKYCFQMSFRTIQRKAFLKWDPKFGHFDNIVSRIGNPSVCCRHFVYHESQVSDPMNLFCEANIKYPKCIEIIGNPISWLGNEIVLFNFHHGIQFYEVPNFIRKTVVHIRLDIILPLDYISLAQKRFFFG